MNKLMTVKWLIVAVVLSGLAACADTGDADEGNEDELSVAEDELRLPGRHRHRPYWWWWWHRHQIKADAGKDAGPAVDGSASEVDSGTVEVDSGTVEVDSGTVEVDSGTVEVDSGTVEVDSGTVEVDSGTVEVDSGTVEVDSGTVEVDSGTVEIDSGTVEVDSGTVEVDSGTVEVDSGTVEIDSGTVEVDSGTLEVDSGTVVVDSGTQGGFTGACSACVSANCNPNIFSGQNLVDDCADSVCRGIVQCAIDTDCALNAENGVDPGSILRCYCGPVSADACAVGSYVPDGDCQAQFEEGVGTTVKSEIFIRLTDAQYSGADGFLLLQCAAEFCPTECAELYE